VQDQKNVPHQGTEEEISQKIIIEIIFTQYKKEEQFSKVFEDF